MAELKSGEFQPLKYGTVPYGTVHYRTSAARYGTILYDNRTILCMYGTYHTTGKIRTTIQVPCTIIRYDAFKSTVHIILEFGAYLQRASDRGFGVNSRLPRKL